MALVHIEDGDIDNQQRLGRLPLEFCTASSYTDQKRLHDSHGVVMLLVLWFVISNFKMSGLFLLWPRPTWEQHVLEQRAKQNIIQNKPHAMSTNSGEQ